VHFRRRVLVAGCEPAEDRRVRRARKLLCAHIMAARSMWNGALKVGKTRIGVKLYAAIEDSAVHFHLLHDRDHERVKQHMVNPVSGEPRERDQIQHGFEIQRGTFVLITNDELAELEPEPSRDIVVASFVPESAIEPAWYERPYYLGPAGKSQDYFALARALAEQKRVGLARWVMRKREYHGALRAHGEHLIVSSLYAQRQVLQPPKVAPLARAADARELAMAEQLIEALAGEFDPNEFRDEHRERVCELIAARAKGKRLKPPPRERRRPARDLGSALEQSLKQLRRQPEQKERLSA
jgi:DNA end-binding protein Ku